ncbi:MAG: helix-turn-helix domain-containing protein [Actinomycetota bacterium]
MRCNHRPILRQDGRAVLGVTVGRPGPDRGGDLIRRLSEEGLPVRMIAERVGVLPGTVYKVLRRVRVGSSSVA